MDLIETAIGEFRFEDTNINDMRYYVIKEINFENGIIILITSDKIPKGKIAKGIIGPNYDNVADCYIYDFICEGSGLNFLNCNNRLFYTFFVLKPHCLPFSRDMPK